MTEDAGNHYRVATLNNGCRVIPKLLGRMSWTVLRLHYQGRTVALLFQEGVHNFGNQRRCSRYRDVHTVVGHAVNGTLKFRKHTVYWSGE